MPTDRLRPYALTLLLFAGIFLIQGYLNSVLAIALIGLLYPGAFLTAYLFGVGPSILFVGLACVSVSFIYGPPPPGLSFHLTAEIVRLFLFGSTTIGMAFLIQRGRNHRRELDAMSERFLRATSAIKLGIWYSDIPTGKIIWDKHARRHLWMADDLEGNLENFMARIHPEDRERVGAAAMEAITQNKEYDVSYRTTNPENPEEIKHIRAMGWVDYDKNGAPLRFDGICFDQSELKNISDENARLLQLAKEAVRIRDEFLSISSHELRTPLTSLEMQLQLFSHVLEHDPAPVSKDRIKKIVDVSERQMKRLNSLVDDLLDVSRIASGKLHLSRAPTDIVQLIHEVRERYRTVLQKNECELVLDLPESVVADVDRLRFEQVLVNLLNNSVKYAPTCRIEISLRVEEGSIYLAVKDNGPGIRPEDQKRIFQRFERAASWEKKGLGLGLYIVNQIVEAHGGEIMVQSDLGKGAVFSVRIPRHLGAVPEASPTKEVTHSSPRKIPHSLPPSDPMKYFERLFEDTLSMETFMKTLVLSLAALALASCASRPEAHRKISSVERDLTGTYLGVSDYGKGTKGYNKKAMRVYFDPIAGEPGKYNVVLLEYVDLLSMAPSYIASNKLPLVAKTFGYLKNITKTVVAYEASPGAEENTFELWPLVVQGDQIVPKKEGKPRTLALSTAPDLEHALAGATISAARDDEPRLTYFPTKEDDRSDGIQYKTARAAYKVAKLKSTWRKKFLRGPYLSQYYKRNDIVLRCNSQDGHDSAEFILNEKYSRMKPKKRAQMFTHPDSAFLKGEFSVSEPRDGMFLFHSVSADEKTNEIVKNKIGLFIDIFDATESLGQDVVELTLIDSERPEDFLMYYEDPENGEGKEKGLR